MLIEETIAKIRRAHLVQGKSIKVTARELRVSRKAVRKVRRTGATESRYERRNRSGDPPAAAGGGPDRS